jgi:hypothetical protein
MLARDIRHRPGDTTLDAEFTAEQFPTNRCVADR